MKKLIFITILFSFGASAFGREFACQVTSDNKKFDDVFLVKVEENGVNSLSYIRRSLVGKIEFKVVKGCENALNGQQSHRPHIISLECADDGEQGFIDIDPETGVGEIYFYKPKLGYGERTSLVIDCLLRVER